ncbi:hypothetical protein, partial [Roseateles sp. P5_E11]
RPTWLVDDFENSEFVPLTESEFSSLVAELCADFVVPAKPPVHSPMGFVSALAMRSLKTDFVVSLIAEYEDEFVHFYWHTTA